MFIHIYNQLLSPIPYSYYSCIDGYFLHKTDQPSEHLFFHSSVQIFQSRYFTGFPHYPLDCRGVILSCITSVCPRVHNLILPYTLLFLVWYYNFVLNLGFRQFPFPYQKVSQHVGFNHLLVILLLPKPKYHPIQYLFMISRRVPAQDVTYDLILWYVSKIIYISY